MFNGLDSRSASAVRRAFASRVLAHDYNSGPLLLLAGPGAGKTHLLLQTIKCNLELGLDHSEFFEATLTNTAAKDFRSEARKEIAPDFDTSSTLHYRAKGILHRHSGKLGVYSGFTVVDKFSEEFVLQDAAHMLSCPYDDASGELREYRRLSARCINPGGQFSDVYVQLQFFFAAVDWFDVVRLATKLLTDFDDVREEECQKFAFLLLDEYQDLNPADQELVKCLLNGRSHFLAAGDDDQSIYQGLRWAHPKGIVEFENQYPTATVEVLPVTSRLPANVIRASYSLIKRNRDRKPKKMMIPLESTDQRASGGFVVSANLKSDKAEREFLRSTIEALLTPEPLVRPEQILVLCSSKALGVELLEYLRGSDCPVPLNSQFEESDTITGAGVLFDLLCDFLKDQRRNLALRVLLAKILGTCDQVPSKLVARAIREPNSLWSTLQLYMAEARQSTCSSKLICFRDAVTEALKLEDILDRAELVAQRVTALTDLLPAVSTARTKGIPAESSAPDDQPSGVRFMTFHSSKGLDADFVFIPFMEDSIELPASDIEETRRLLYVGMTRAKIGVIFSWAWSRRSQSRFKSKGTGGPPTKRSPSRFILQCGISPNLTKPGASVGAGHVARELVIRYAKAAAAYDRKE